VTRQSLALELGVEATPEQRERLALLVREHLTFAWRCLRRLGLSVAEADDAVQHVFLVLARRLSAVQPGHERAFLLSAAVRIAASTKRRIERRREQLTATLDTLLADSAPSPDLLLEQRRARELLDGVLCQMSLEHRTVLLLIEMEQLTMPEAAELLRLPLGTVASRLRRARAEFNRRLARIEAALGRAGGSP
jgi:RNA polymerase sigma-70 factor, ECF subfamily